MQIDGSELPSESRTEMTTLERWGFPGVVVIIALYVLIGALVGFFISVPIAKQHAASCAAMNGKMKDGVCCVDIKDFPKR